MTVRTLDSFTYCYLYSLSLPAFLISAIATTQFHPPTWASPVSVPESRTTTRGHLPTWALFVSVPAYRLPNQNSSPFRSRSYYMPISPPLLVLFLAYHNSSKMAQSCLSVASWYHHIFLLPPPPSYPVSLAHTSNKGRIAALYATVVCCHSM